MVRTLTLTAIILVALTGCSGSHSGPSQTTAENPKANEPGGVIADSALTNLDAPLRDAAASARVVTYTSRSGVDDSATHVSASIFVPKRNPPEGGFPIVALGHETTGTPPNCAPSLSPNLRHSATKVQALLNATAPPSPGAAYAGAAEPTNRAATSTIAPSRDVARLGIIATDDSETTERAAAKRRRLLPLPGPFADLDDSPPLCRRLLR